MQKLVLNGLIRLIKKEQIMSKLYTIEKDIVYPGIEIRKQTFYNKGNDEYVPLSRTFTGKDEELIYLKHNARVVRSFRRVDRLHQDIITEGDIWEQMISGTKKHNVIGGSRNSDRILVLIKYLVFKIENNNHKKENSRKKITTLTAKRDFNLVEIFPKEDITAWNTDGIKVKFSFDQIISSI